MSQTDVSYSCGSCGYPLNLTSSSRSTSGTSPGYLKSVQKGSKTQLLCRKCGMFIGYGHGHGKSPALCGLNSHTSSCAPYKKVMIKIRALQPSEEPDNIENGG